MSSWAPFSPSGDISNQIYHNINLTIKQRFLPRISVLMNGVELALTAILFVVY